MTSSLASDLQDRVASTERWARTALASQPRSTGFDSQSWQELARFGLFGLTLPVPTGGEGLGAQAVVAVLEAMGRGGGDRGLLMAAGAHLFGCIIPVAAHGTPGQCDQWLPALRTGEVIGALAVTERDGGSAFDQMATTATATSDGIALHGRKTLICNAMHAGLLLVLARQYPDRGALGLTAFLVPRGAQGVHVEPIGAAAGLPGAAMGELVLDHCTLPDSAILGRPGTGLRVFMTAMKWERCGLLAGFLGAAERDLASCVKTLAQRGDGVLLRHQAVTHRMARIKVRLETARLMLQRAASSIDAGHDDHAGSAMAKLVISEALVDCAQDTARLLAGSGWRGTPFDTGAALVDALGGLFASGTSEVQLDLIARAVLAEARHP
jgi:alkylation response protein AidB-like acyl-CoA dehydrogenase